jgi:hypothetical protein
MIQAPLWGRWIRLWIRLWGLRLIQQLEWLHQTRQANCPVLNLLLQSANQVLWTQVLRLV